MSLPVRDDVGSRRTVELIECAFGNDLDSIR
jgi:hypothetical protein